jgi:effector-binding domain-containing protein
MSQSSVRVSVALVLLAALATVLAATARAQEDVAERQPAERGAAEEPAADANGAWSIGEMRVQEFDALPYAYVSAETTLAGLAETIPQLIDRLESAMASGGMDTVGPVVFVYHGFGGEANRSFKLDVGVLAEKVEGKNAPDMTFGTLEPLEVATIIYTGPVTQLQGAYQKLFGQIAEEKLVPSGVVREFYLYWEGPDSENNVVQIQAGLKPAQP